jgi:hypothetical protein
MSTTTGKKQVSLSERFIETPGFKKAHKKGQDPFKRFAQRMDAVGLLDDQGRAAVDEKALRQLLAESLPRAAVDGLIHQLRQLPDSQLVEKGKDDDDRGLKAANWAELVQHVDDLGIDARFEKLDTESVKGPADVRKLVKALEPGMRDDLFDQEKFGAKVKAIVADLERSAAEGEQVAADAIPKDIWDCLVRNFGFWVVLSMAVVLGAAMVALTVATGGLAPAIVSTSAWAVFWILTAFGLTGTTVTLVGNCIMNPTGFGK